MKELKKVNWWLLAAIFSIGGTGIAFGSAYYARTGSQIKPSVIITLASQERSTEDLVSLGRTALKNKDLTNANSRTAQEIEASPVIITADGGAAVVNFSIEKEGLVSGRVVDTEGLPLSNLHVYAVADTCGEEWLGGTNTDDNGYYTLTLPEGSVYISACPICSGLNYANKWYDNTTQCNEATQLNVITGQRLDGINFSLDWVSTIFGRLTDPDGKPVPNVHVYAAADACNGPGLVGENTNDDGYYTLYLQEGVYYVKTFPTQRGLCYIDVWHDDTDDCQQASPITVSKGQNIEINFHLKPGASISGMVKDQTTQGPLKDVSCGCIDLGVGWHELVYRHEQMEGGAASRAAFKAPGDLEWRWVSTSEMDLKISSEEGAEDGITLITKKNTWNLPHHPENHEELVQCVDTDAQPEYDWYGQSVVPEINHNHNIHGNDGYYTSFYKTYFYVGAEAAGRWCFSTDSDESSEIVIDDQVVSYWYGLHGTAEKWEGKGEIRLLISETMDWVKNVFIDPNNGRYNFCGLTPGSYKLEAVAPGYNYEFFEETGSWEQANIFTITDSEKISDINFTLEKILCADLQATSVIVPAEVNSGQSVDISWTVKNIGDGTAIGSWYDCIFLYSDEQFVLDTFLGGIEYPYALEAGESYYRTQTISIPDGLEGDFQIMVATDCYGDIQECQGDNDNQSARAIRVILSRYPDLRVTSVEPPDLLMVYAGTSVPISWIITNEGQGDTDNPLWYDELWLSSDSVLNRNSDIFLKRFENPSYLAQGESYLETKDVTIPERIYGAYYVIVATDSYNKIYEYQNESNNEGYSADPIVITIPPLMPDLQVTSLQAQGIGYSGQPVSLTWSVTNKGGRSTNISSWTDSVFLSEDEFLNISADMQLVSFSHEGVILPDESYTRTEEITLPKDKYGPYHLFVFTDSGDGLFEYAGENNNINHKTNHEAIEIIFVPPDLELTTVTAADTAFSGQSLTVEWTVKNSGLAKTPENSWIDAFFLSQDMELYSDEDYYLGSWTSEGQLDVDGMYSGMKNITIPHGISGSYYLILKTDNNNTVFEYTVGEPGGEENNSKPKAIEIISHFSDLKITSVTLSSDNIRSGDIFEVSWVVENAGTDETKGEYWKDKVYLSDDMTFNIDGTKPDTFLGEFPHEGSLAANESYTRTENLTSQGCIAGNHSLFIITDADNHIYEQEGEENNSSMASLQLDPTLAPDLIISSFNTENMALSGQPLTIDWELTNIGEKRTEKDHWTDAVYLSEDNFFDLKTDILLTEFIGYCGFLEIGETCGKTATVNLPNGLSGDYYLFIETDINNELKECAPGAEGNNLSDSNVIVNLDIPPGVDLTVISVDAPDTATSGQPITINWTVQNNGQSGTNISQWHDSLYLSKDLILDQTDYQLGYLGHIGAIAQGESYEVSTQIILPKGIGNRWYVLIYTDKGDKVYEHEAENNNIGYDPYSIEVMIPPPADLVVSNITHPSSGITGESITITWTVTNQGDYEASGKWNDAIYFSSDNIWDIGDTRLGYAEHSDALVPGGQYVGTLTTGLPGVTPGEYYVIVRTDIKNNIREGTDESNNIVLSTGTISTDAFELTLNAPYESQFATETRHYYKVTVPEGEDLLITLNCNSNTAFTELYVRYDMMPDRGHFDFIYDQPFEPDQEITVPGTKTGTYYVLAYGYALSGLESYTIKAEILSPGIRKAEPAVCGNTGRVTFKITGAKFDQDTSFMINDSRENEYPGDIVHLMDSHSAYAIFDLTGAIPGAANLKVPDASSIPFPFTILDGGEAHIRLFFSGPSTVRAGNNAIYSVFIKNEGLVDSEAMLLTISSMDTELLSQQIGNLYPGQEVYINWTTSIDNIECKTFQASLSTQSQDSQANITILSSPVLLTTCVVRSYDPNEKRGPAGYAEEKPVSSDQLLPYTIYFENISEATAPVQQARIIDQLDSNLDWRTFRLVEIGFGNKVISIPENRSFYQNRLELGPEYSNLLLDIDAGIDIFKGEAHWIMTTIDPATGEQPEDPAQGFLVPNDSNHAGEGYVTFTIKAAKGLATGTKVGNKAGITFDLNEPIETNIVSNTIDGQAPVSQISYLPPEIDGNSIDLHWSGTDDADGSGLSDYIVYVSQDNVPYTPWLINTKDTSAVFVGERGHSYSFYSSSMDYAGNRESAPDQPDAAIFMLTPNDPPQILSISPETGEYKDPLLLTATFQDMDGDEILAIEYEYSLDQGETWVNIGENNTPSASYEWLSGLNSDSVLIKARAHDGRCWGEWYTNPSCFLIDNLPPETTDNAPSGWQYTKECVLIHLTPSDESSGLDGSGTTYYFRDSNTPSEGTDCSICSPGLHELRYYSIDDAGNKEETKSLEIRIGWDNDNDGYYNAACTGTDCNDDDAAIFPGAFEACDGIDNDCDGVKDNACFQRIPLEEGWNLVSFQINTCFYDGNMPTVFIPEGVAYEKVDSLAAWLSDDNISPIRDKSNPEKCGDWQRIISFDNKGSENDDNGLDPDGAHLLDKDLPHDNNTLHYLSGGYGYWINMNKPGELIIHGPYIPSDAEITLKEGWNLIGFVPAKNSYGNQIQEMIYPYAADYYSQEEGITYCYGNHIETVFAGIEGKYRRIISFDPYNGGLLYDTELPYFINTLYYLGPKYGYWIKVLEDTELVFPIGCGQ